MDIRELESIVAQDEEGVVMTVYQKNDEPYLAPDGSPCTMTILGAESKRVIKATEVAQRKLARRGNQEATVSYIRIERAASAVTAWTGWMDGDQPYPCTPENVRVLCRAPHILYQIEAARDGHANFFTKPSQS